MKVTRNGIMDYYLSVLKTFDKYSKNPDYKEMQEATRAVRKYQKEHKDIEVNINTNK